MTTHDTLLVSAVDGSYLPQSDLDISSFKVLSSPKLVNLKIDYALGVFEIQPAPYRTGLDNLQFEICTNSGDCYQVSLALFIDPWNTVTPVSDNIITFKNTPVENNFFYNDFDAESDSIYIMLGGIMTGDTKGQAVLLDNAGGFTYSPPMDFVGKDLMEYIISDTVTPPTVRNAYINARIVNRNPSCTQTLIANPDNYIVPLNGIVQGNVLWNDMDITHDSSLLVTITPIEGPFLGSVDISPNGDFTYTAARNSLYLESIRYEVCNQDPVCSSCDTSWLYLRVGMDKVGPCLDIKQPSQDGFNAGCNEKQLEGEIIDPNTAPHPFYISPSPILAPQHGTVTWDTTGHYIYTPNAGYSGPDRFGYEICKKDASDGSIHACTKASTLIMIFNQTPIVALDDHMVIQGSNTADINPIANDFDQEYEIDSQSLKILQSPQHGIAGIIPGAQVRYTPNTGYQGQDSIIYSICDQVHLCAAATCDTATIYYDIQAPMAIGIEGFDVYINTRNLPELRWRMFSSNNPKGYFQVMRSTGGDKWSVIDEIDYDHNRLIPYTYEDNKVNSLPKHTLYYKIIYFDDKTTSISEMKSVHIGDPNFSVEALYPNPVKDELFLRGIQPSNVKEINFFDANGRPKMQLRYLAGNALDIEIRGWSKGIYFYEIILYKGEAITGKLIKL